MDVKKIESKWQRAWEKKKVFSVDADKKKKKFYNLEMFPYPSGLGLHMGHALNFTIGDIRARMKRMQGFNVLYPMGYDSFGLPAENAAIKAGTHPSDYTKEAINNFIGQQKALGLSYDWYKIVSTCEPEYYKWNQKFFIEFLKKGLVYRKNANVNWCPKCATVLANEQVVNGCCWRHEDTEVEIKPLEQWFIKTTQYADELLDMVDDLDWPERIKIMQKNWIGKSFGAEIDFEVDTLKGTSKNEKISNVDILPAKTKDAEIITTINAMGWRDNNTSSETGVTIDFLEKEKGFTLPPSKERIESTKKYIKENPESNYVAIIDKKVVGWIGLTFHDDKKISYGVYVHPDYQGKRIGSSLINFVHKKYSDYQFFIEVVSTNTKAIKLYEKLGYVKESEGKHKVGNLFLPVDVMNYENKFVSKEKFPIFTTRPDTIFGVTFMVIAAQHPRLMEFVTKEQKKDVEKFLKKIKSVSEKTQKDLEKEGVFTGSYAVNPATGERVPIWAGNFVLAEYGSGMVMAVPSHDKRDFAFAKKYGIEIKPVIRPVYGKPTKNDVHRDTVTGIVHRKSDDKFLMLKGKGKFNWITPVIGGIEKGESIEDAAIREVLEETGYKTKFVKTLGEKIESYFYAAHKEVWRSRMDQPVLLELISEKQEKISDEESAKHEVFWMSADEILENANFNEDSTGLRIYLGEEEAYVGSGKLINSDKFNDLENEKAKKEILKWLEKKGLGREKVQYKMRDWLISRQRYWGTPIPVVYCDKCGIVPVPEKDLPVLLPKDVKFGKGNPLATNKDFVNCKCPVCGAPARRETDTMDTFVDSSWYYMRYPDNKNSAKPFDKKKVDYWLPVDSYIGGAEHATMHLLYARFWTKALRDLGYVNFDEPFKQLFNQGMLHASDGRKMSKSLGNVINPLVIVEKEGADALRLTLMSFASPDSDTNWDDKVLQGSFKFLNKVYENYSSVKIGKSSARIESKLNQAIKEVTEDLENFKYNLGIIKLRNLFNSLGEEESKDVLEKCLQLLHPICPHLTEELWSKLKNKNFICLSKWPVSDEKKINKDFEKQEQAVEKLVSDLNYVKNLILEKNKTYVKKGFVYVLPNELEIYSEMKNDLEKRTDLEIQIFAVNDKEKYDPENKSKNVKPNKAGIYLE